MRALLGTQGLGYLHIPGVSHHLILRPLFFQGNPAN